MEETTFYNIFDSHTHYDDPRFEEDREELLQALPQGGIRAVMAVGADMPTSISSAALAAEYPYIFAAVGIHPHSAKEATDTLEQELETLVRENSKVRAIGEVGLDYYYDHSPRQIQAEVFVRQLEVAKKLDLPVILHSREAQQDTFDIIEKHQPRAVLHSYSGSAEMAKEYVKLGLYFGFTGVLTFKNARRALEAVEVIPMDRLLLETDCPYMAPTPLRGKRSDSTMLPYIAKVMAELKGVSVQEIFNITFENTCRLYGIDPKEVPQQ